MVEVDNRDNMLGIGVRIVSGHPFAITERLASISLYSLHSNVLASGIITVAPHGRQSSLYQSIGYSSCVMFFFEPSHGHWFALSIGVYGDGK